MIQNKASLLEELTDLVKVLMDETDITPNQLDRLKALGEDLGYPGKVKLITLYHNEGQHNNAILTASDIVREEIEKREEELNPRPPARYKI